MKKPLVFSIAPKGDDIARHIAQLLAAPVHLCGAGRAEAGPLIGDAYRAGAPIVGVCAAAVLIRLLAGDLGERATEPPVVAVSADGKIAVPLLGGHRGANALARWIAEGFRGVAAITALSDTLYDFSLDDPPPGYVLANPQAVRPVLAALLKGEKLRVEGPSAWLELAGYPVDRAGSQLLRVTERVADGPGLVVHPRTLVAGVGCAAAAEADEVVALVAATLSEAGYAPLSLAALASIESQAQTPALAAAAARLEVPLRVFSQRELARERSRIPNPSAAVEAAIGIPGVCEAAAIKAGTLAVEKRRSAHATCAIGRADTPIDVERFGKAGGS